MSFPIISLSCSVSVNVWTDSIQSELAMKMFEQPLPGEHLLEGLDVATRAHLAVATVKEVVTAVYKDIENSSEEDQQVRPCAENKILRAWFLAEDFVAFASTLHVACSLLFDCCCVVLLV